VFHAELAKGCDTEQNPPKSDTIIYTWETSVHKVIKYNQLFSPFETQF